MYSSVELALAYRFANAPMRLFPFPHLYISEIFPPGFYGEMMRHLPPPEMLTPVGEARGAVGYEDRFVQELSPAKIAPLAEPYRSFWSGVQGWMCSGRFLDLVASKFGPFIERRFKSQQFKLVDEAMLVYDRTRFSQGPHTDTPAKVVSVLFYLPADERMKQYGTSIYLPKDPGFTCPGGPHHAFDRFERMETMPFLPNSMFAFLKTDDSFHGVEPITEEGIGRYLLFYDLKVAKQAAAPRRF